MGDSPKPGSSLSSCVVLIAMALMGVGLAAVATASASLDRPLFGAGFFSSTLGRQVLFVGAGLCLLLVVRSLTIWGLESSWIRRWGPRVLFGLTMLGLAATLIPGLGLMHGGSHRWLRLGYGGVEIGAQPSELSKVALVLMLGWMLGHRGADPRSFRRCFVPGGAIIGLTVVLVGFEDFGTAALLACVGGVMMFAAGCRLSHLIPIALVGALSMASLLFVHDYRVNRITAFLSGYDDPRGMDYQPMQSLATLASGGWTGTGLGLGTQKYGYLPASRTDFVFSVFCEETGVVGGLMIIALFGVLVWLGMRVMQRAPTRLEQMVVLGIMLTIGLQALMNLAVATVLVPTTGISLPLVSAGGSGILTFCPALGIVAGIAQRGANQEAHEVWTAPPVRRHFPYAAGVQESW